MTNNAEKSFWTGLANPVCFSYKQDWKAAGLRRCTMTAQEAGQKILTEVGKPLKSTEIAEMALARHYVASSAKDPVFSIATSIEKNIRNVTYNSPRLVFIRTERGRCIGLPSMEEAGKTEKKTACPQSPAKKEILAPRLPEELIERIQLAVQAKLAPNYDETLALLIQKGLSASAAEIRERLLSQLDNI
jgi:hypothetical protein